MDTGEALPGGRGSRWSKGAALCLGFSVVQQVSQTTSVQTASSPLAYHIYGASSTTLLKKKKRSDDDASQREAWIVKSNAAQLHPFKIFFVHICIQLYFLANLLSLSVGFI